jgi:hypothetical protein
MSAPATAELTGGYSDDLLGASPVAVSPFEGADVLDVGACEPQPDKPESASVRKTNTAVYLKNSFIKTS